MGFRVSLVAVAAEQVEAVFDRFGLQKGRRVSDIDPGEGLDEPLKSMMAEMGAIHTPAIGFGTAEGYGVFNVNLKTLDTFEVVDANIISKVARVWMLEVHENSGVSTLSHHLDGVEVYSLAGVSDQGFFVSGDCPYDAHALHADNKKLAAERSRETGRKEVAEEYHVPQDIFAEVTGGVSYAGDFINTMVEVSGKLPVIDGRRAKAES